MQSWIESILSADNECKYEHNFAFTTTNSVLFVLNLAATGSAIPLCGLADNIVVVSGATAVTIYSISTYVGVDMCIFTENSVCAGRQLCARRLGAKRLWARRRINTFDANHPTAETILNIVVLAKTMNLQQSY